MHTVVRMKFGSHLYGTNTPQSDLDFKSIIIPDAKDIILQRAPNSIKSQGRQKEEGEKNQPGDVDEEKISLQQFLKLAAEGQTLAIDMLFAPDSAILEKTPLWEYLQENRHKLLTKRSAAFVGYCRQQANKYGIKGSRVAAAYAASEFFTNVCRELGPTCKVGSVAYAFGPAQLFNEHTQVVHQETTPGQEEMYFECCNRKVPFSATVKTAAEVFTRIYYNYGDRARKAQANEGIDWKALSHAVRVGQEAVELLKTGHVTFPLPDAEGVKAIKQGLVPYSEVADKIESLLVEVEEASAASTLPDKANHRFIDQVVYDAYLSSVLSYQENQLPCVTSYSPS